MNSNDAMGAPGATNPGGDLGRSADRGPVGHTRPTQIVKCLGLLAVLLGGGLLWMRLESLALGASYLRQSDGNSCEGCDVILDRLHDDLQRLTVSDPSTPAGYFVYHEGPECDTTRLNGAESFSSVNETQVGARDRSSDQLTGDTDDYLACTVELPSDSKVVANLPSGILEAARAVDSGQPWRSPAGYDPARLEPVGGRYAEVSYWMRRSPKSDESHAGPSANSPVPQVGSVFCRRVALLRDDLNVSASDLLNAGLTPVEIEGVDREQPLLWFLHADGRVEPWTPGLSNSGGEADDISDLGLSVASLRAGDEVSDLCFANSLDSFVNEENRFRPSDDSGSSQPTSTVTGLLAFDVRVFDAEAPLYLTVGADAEPGVAGADDDGNGIVDHLPAMPQRKDVGEFGAMKSDDSVSTPADATFAEVVRLDSAHSAAIAKGTFVDFGYAISPLGNVRLGVESDADGPVLATHRRRLSTPFSGIGRFDDGGDRLAGQELLLPLRAESREGGAKADDSPTSRIPWQLSVTLRRERDGDPRHGAGVDVRRTFVVGP